MRKFKKFKKNYKKNQQKTLFLSTLCSYSDKFMNKAPICVSISVLIPPFNDNLITFNRKKFFN